MTLKIDNGFEFAFTTRKKNHKYYLNIKSDYYVYHLKTTKKKKKYKISAL